MRAFAHGLSSRNIKQGSLRRGRQATVHRLLRQRAGAMTAREISAVCAEPLRTIQRTLTSLVGYGFVIRTSRDTVQGREVVYRAVAP